MKKGFYLFSSVFIVACIGVCLVSSCNKLTPTPPPADSTHTTTSADTTVDLARGLLLYLPLNGSFADSSGNGNTVTGVNGAALGVDEHGYANSAFNGTGNGDLITVSNNGSIQFDTALTVSFHFMTKNPNVEQVFFSIVNYADGHAASFQAGIGNSGDSLAVYDYLTTGVVDTTIGCSNWSTPASAGRAVSTFKPVQYAWYEYTGVFNKGKIDEYINGQLIGTITRPNMTKANFCTSNNIIIGGWWEADPRTINGKMDDIRLYGRSLNANEIARLARGYHQ